MRYKILKRMIILCWIILFTCFAIKLFGGNFFQIIYNNKYYRVFCNYVDTYLWTQIIIGSISTFLLNTLFLLAVNRKLKFTRTECIFVIISTIICTIIKVLNAKLGLLVDIYQMLILPFIIKTDCLIEHKIRYVIFGNILVLLFQVISLLTKNLTLSFITNDTFTAFIFTIDVFIMCTLYYLYMNTKREVKMSWFMSWLWGKSDTQLESMKKKRELKITKLQANPTEAHQKKINKLQAEILVLANELTRRNEQNNETKN